MSDCSWDFNEKSLTGASIRLIIDVEGISLDIVFDVYSLRETIRCLRLKPVFIAELSCTKRV
jgi:hypothetical protein